LLTTIFSRLKNRSGLEITIANWATGAIDPMNAKTLETLTGRCLVESCDIERPVNVVLESMALASFHAEALTIKYLNAYWTYHWLVTGMMYEHAKQVFSGLKKLDLRMSPDDVPDEETELRVSRLMKSAQNLERLVICCDGLKDGDYAIEIDRTNSSLLRITLSIKFPQLRYLEIIWGMLNLDHLLTFVICNTTLEKVALGTCIFTIGTGREGSYDAFNPGEVKQHDRAIVELVQQKTGLSEVIIRMCVVEDWEQDRQKWGW
jgi:hypothetical protein